MTQTKRDAVPNIVQLLRLGTTYQFQIIRVWESAKQVQKRTWFFSS